MSSLDDCGSDHGTQKFSATHLFLHFTVNRKDYRRDVSLQNGITKGLRDRDEKVRRSKSE